jgi:hypothetical protein
VNYETMPMKSIDDAALFAAMSEGMGMRHSDLATYLGVPGDNRDQVRIVRRWCTGVRPVPVPVFDAVERLYTALEQEVDRREADVVAAQARGEAPVLATYRKIDQLHAAEPDLAYLSLEYHRAILLRVWESTSAPIIYAGIPDDVA